MVTQDQDEYVPMQPLADPDYEASARTQMEGPENSNEITDGLLSKAKLLNDYKHPPPPPKYV